MQETGIHEEQIVAAKICGLCSVQDALCAADAGAAYAGVICVPRRRRTVAAAEAIAISHALQGSQTKLVGVFQNQSVGEIIELSTNYNLDVVQLHGDEDEQFIAQLYKAIKDLKLIKRCAFPKDCQLALRLVERYDENGIKILFDSAKGGTGELLDWKAIERWSIENGNFPYILAGGLTPQNVYLAIKLKGITGVDVSGGVENESGSKDLEKVKEFVRVAKSDACL